MRLHKLLPLTFSALTLIACGDEEEKVKFVPKPKAKPTIQQPAEDAEFQDMASLNKKETSKFKKEAPTRLNLSSEIPKPRASGAYVLQVGVSDDKDLADNLIARIEEMGYEPYTVKVENPAELVGTFYRVRLGYFNTVTDARLFGHNVLKPKNIGFWIDNSANDALGEKDAPEEQAMEQPVASEQATTQDDWVEDPAPAKTEAPKAVSTDESTTTPEKMVETAPTDTPMAVPEMATPQPEKAPEAPLPETMKTPEVKKVDGDSWEEAPKKAQDGNWEDDSWN